MIALKKLIVGRATRDLDMRDASKKDYKRLFTGNYVKPTCLGVPCGTDFFVSTIGVTKLRF